MDQNIIRIGMKAPDFSATTTFGPLNMSDLQGKWVVMFSHPGDFTPVCTTEFIAFSQMAPCFAQRNAQLLGLSIDSNPSHLAWVYNIYLNTGIQIPFPIIADRDGSIARLYGMIAPDVSSTETIRSVFIIDDKQVIRAILSYPQTNGRNIPEILRLVIALQTSAREKVATPANWIPGQPVVVPVAKTYNELIERVQNPQAQGLTKCMDWYLCFKQI
ncbi:MAG: peroxiredoxin [Clostridia bacterium]|nr:peroxiredoxin [Clostridia bacterium]